MNETKSNGLIPIIAQAIELMEAKLGHPIPLKKVNLAELRRLTGISRGKLRTLKRKGFIEDSLSKSSCKTKKSKFEGYEEFINTLLKLGITNSPIILARLRDQGFTGGLTIVKNYIAEHKDLVPAKRVLVAPKGNRGNRFSTGPGEAFQMDWGFTKVIDPAGKEYEVACFAIICHHCGAAYIEFFPSAKQENLFIGMINAFVYLGIPDYVLTDNMKSVVIKRDMEGHPIWQHDYEAFMKTVGFNTRLCKPRHPYTKGKVERLVRFVKTNFLTGKVFMNLTDLNREALEWCNEQNSSYRKFLDDAPSKVHNNKCACNLHKIDLTDSLKFYLAPLRKISFDGFINYENRRYGVPYKYTKQFARVMRRKDTLYIYSDDLKQLLVTHEVTWSRKDSICTGQFEALEQPEEFPSVPVKTVIQQIPQEASVSFDKFNFDDMEDVWDE